MLKISFGKDLKNSRQNIIWSTHLNKKHTLKLMSVIRSKLEPLNQVT